MKKMLRKLTRGAFVLGVTAALALSGGTQASIYVIRGDGEAADEDEATVELNVFTGGWDITLLSLYNPGGETVYEILGTGGERIDNVYIDVPCWEGPDGTCVPAGSPVYVRIVGDAPAGIRSIGNVEQRGTAETYLLDVQATEDIGAVSAMVIGDVQAGRDVIGPVVSTIRDHPNLGIFRVEAQRDIRGDVLAEDGRIVTVYAHRDIGRAGEPVRIAAKHRIMYVAAIERIFADVTTRVDGSSGGLLSLATGRFAGSIVTHRLLDDPDHGAVGRIWVWYEFDGAIELGAGHDRPGQEIILPRAEDVSGQIVLNADGEPGAAWSRPIHLGNEGDPMRITLDGPEDVEAAGPLGGLSVGLVPFSLHRSSCAPPDGGVSNRPADGIILRHHGPVALDGLVPVVVERRPTDSVGALVPVPASHFDYSIDAADPTALVVVPAPGHTGFEAGYEYYLSSTTDLVCATDGRPPVDWNGSYFAVMNGSDCPADLDGDGTVDIADVLALLFVWGPCPGCAADLNDTDTVGLRDLLEMLTAWGPCQ